MRMTATSADWLTAIGLVCEVVAAFILSTAQASITKLENWGYANPIPTC